MISNFEFNETTLRWDHGNQAITQTYEKIEYAIYNETEVLVQCFIDGQNQVILFSESGDMRCRLEASDSLQLGYLTNHTRFGLCVVCCVKNSEGRWSDHHYGFNGIDQFERKCFAR